MDRYRAIRVREFCCGCSLRTGTLILLWCTGVLEAIDILTHSYVILSTRNNRRVLSTILWCYYVFLFVTDLVGLITSVFGIYGTQKNESKYLKGFYYYFIFDVVYQVLTIFLLISSPYHFLTTTSVPFIVLLSSFIPYYGTSFELVVILAITLIFYIALRVYFLLIVKSFYELVDHLKPNTDNENKEGNIREPRTYFI